jgi:chromate transporter
VLAAYLLGLNEIALLFGGGAFVVLVKAGRRLASWRGGLLAGALPLAGSLPFAAGGVASVSIVTLFLTFLKIGSILYGSGYVLLAFLRNDFVERLGWLTEEQLLDAIAIGQVTPGPFFTSATFIGYLLEGFPGAVLATLGIFLPSFIFVAIAYPLVPRLRASAVASSFLDGVNVSALGLMAGVTWVLARSAIVDWATALVAAVATLLALRYRINAALLVLAGALFGLVYRALS